MCKGSSQLTFPDTFTRSAEDRVDEATFFEVARAVEALLSKIHYRYQAPYLTCSIFEKLQHKQHWSSCANDTCSSAVLAAKKAIIYKITLLEYIQSHSTASDGLSLAAQIKRRQSPYATATSNWNDIQSLKNICCKSFSVCNFLYGICAAYRDMSTEVLQNPTWYEQDSLIENRVLENDCTPENFRDNCLPTARQHAYEKIAAFCKEVKDTISKSKITRAR